MYNDELHQYNSEELSKAMNRAGLVQKEVTVHTKNGTYTRVQWANASDDEKYDKNTAKEDGSNK